MGKLPPALSAQRSVDPTVFDFDPSNRSALGVFNPADPIGGLGNIIGGEVAKVNPLSWWHGVSDVASSVGTAVSFATDPRHWIRLAEAFAGAMLIVIGLVAILWDTKAGETARSVAPVAGKAAAAL